MATLGLSEDLRFMVEPSFPKMDARISLQSLFAPLQGLLVERAVSMQLFPRLRDASPGVFFPRTFLQMWFSAGFYTISI